MSVCPSVSLGAGSQEPCRATPPLPPPCPTLETEPETGMVSNLGGSQQAGPGPQPLLWLRVLCVCMCVRACVCMYVHGEPVCKYVQGGVMSQAEQVGLKAGLPGVASSQVDSP